MSIDTDVIIIGAGVVGLAAAAAVAREDRAVYVLERNAAFGRETSSRNSGTIHTGILSPAGSLNARLCVESNPLVYELCERYSVEHRRTGKLLVATDAEESRRLEQLTRRTEEGIAMSLLSRAELRRTEPDLNGEAALLLPDAGVMDAYGFVYACYSLAAGKGVQVVYDTEVTGLERAGDEWTVTYTDREGTGSLQARAVINCAGHTSDAVTEMAGIADGPRNYYFKGEYYTVDAARAARMGTRLVYPMMRPDGLVGIHTVLDVNGQVKLGPYFYPVDDIDYATDDSRRQVFLEGIRKLYPFVEAGDIEPESSGIMPRTYAAGEPFREFYIRHEDERGLPGLFNLVGIESPGLTAAPAIGKYVTEMVDGYLGG